MISCLLFFLLQIDLQGLVADRRDAMRACVACLSSCGEASVTVEAGTRRVCCVCLYVFVCGYLSVVF